MADSGTPAAPTNTPKRGIMKAVLGGVAGLAAGGLGVYATAIIDHVAKPAKPVANFAVSVEGMNVTCQNHASGESGWWDFGDGTPLLPFKSDQPNITHTYAKAGTFPIKLSVRNFIMEENERTVPVELAASSAVPGGPVIPSFTVEAIGGAVSAPATFRIRGEVRNADRVIWDLGTEQLEVAESTGPFEKLVVFEKPGPYQLQLIGYSGKQAVKRAAQVNVVEARNGSLSVTIRVTDSGTNVERKEFAETLALPLPAKGIKQLERTIIARNGYRIAEAKLGAVVNAPISNLRLEIAKDQRSAKLLGEWTADRGSKASTPDVLVPMVLTEERSTSLPGRVQNLATQFQLTGAFLYPDANAIPLTATLPLPEIPAGVVGHKRTMQLEIREVTADQQSKVLGAIADIKPPFRGTVVNLSGKQQIVDVQQISNGQLRVTLSNATGRSS